jgi:DNA-binding LacI/PurR family transcriptional regulator
MKPPKKSAPKIGGVERPPNLIVQVERLLRQAIAENRFPGGRLPTEIELGEQLGVSRETVRLAAEVLQREGLLEKVRRRGTFVREPGKGEPSAGKTAPIVYVQAGYSAHDEEEAVTPAIDDLMMQGAVDEAARAGIRVLVQRPRFTDVARTVEGLHREQAFQGLIFATYGEEKFLRRVVGWGFPTVLLDHSLPRIAIPYVREDSFGGARLAVGYLAGLGHRHIAFMNWNRSDLNPWRIQGYRQALREAGIARRKAFELSAELTPAGAKRAVAEYLSLSPRPTALYCFNNTLARHVIAALQSHGVRVPEDVSVLGGGGEEVEGLTCHQAAWSRLGRVAVQLLLKARKGRHVESHLGAHSLQTGETTAPPAVGQERVGKGRGARR